ncbi:MAG: ABC transporter ATP-binding protein [Chloroflexi bacterium]|nr:ABC transporter ATP-binding protein [Chloroflexota bacterium]MDA1219883.1 ABC transporter ATP-binding protein [Chloroflexota bacterium]
MSTVIQARNLTKRYKDFLAVNSISFDIRQGECFGFLGPNGAGKTSTIRMITCTSPITDGELMVDGKDVRKNQKAIKSVLGVVSQADSLDPGLNVTQNLMSYGRYFNLPSKVARQRVGEALDFVHLRDKADQSIDELSGGMRRRLLIARALLHEPRVLVLDEPTSGLDPQSRLLVWEKLSHLKSQGITILLTTHYMEEASYLCDRLLVLDAGEILVEGTPDDLVKQQVGAQVTEVRVSNEEKGRIMDALAGRGFDLDDRGDSIVIYQKGGQGMLDDLDLGQNRLTSRPANLEDVFLKLTGRGLREE